MNHPNPLPDAKLLPCPWCGSPARIYKTQRANMFGVECAGESATCEVTILGPHGKTIAEAVERWNRRDPITAAATRVADAELAYADAVMADHKGMLTTSLTNEERRKISEAGAS